MTFFPEDINLSFHSVIFNLAILQDQPKFAVRDIDDQNPVFWLEKGILT